MPDAPSNDKSPTTASILKAGLYIFRVGALVQWLKLPACKVGDRELEPLSGIQVSKKQYVSFLLTRK